jgi:iron(III) transport system ATP-binding protein
MLKVTGLYTEYPGADGKPVKAAQDVSFEVPRGTLFTLLGPSGCGKTTTLRSIAGLERPTAGEITVDDQSVYSSGRRIFVAPNLRNFGMVFQSYAIWPHMNVFQNVAFPLEVRKNRPSRREIADKVMSVLTAMKLDPFADRAATQLSGGQQQRLALARALAMEPQLLLLDEPLSNLDAKLREAMRFELKRLQRELKITTVYVTHDQSEALALSHRIAVMNEGRVAQIGPPREIYEKPANRFVADFVGTANFLDGTVQTAGPGRCDVATAVGVLHVQPDGAQAPGSKVVISVRPEDVELCGHRPAPAEGYNICAGTVAATAFLGETLDVQLKVGDRTLQARAHPSLQAAIGDPIHIRMKADKCIAIPN